MRASGHLLRMMTFKDFQREGGGMCVPNGFILEVLGFGLSDIQQFQFVGY